MSRIFALLLILISHAPTVAQQPKSRLVLDLWDAAYLQGERAGYVHTFVEELDHNGDKLWRATVQLRLTVKRGGEVKQLGMDSGTYEDERGKVVGTFLKHFLGKGKTLEIEGVVANGMLNLTVDMVKPLRPAPWNDQVIGIGRQQRLLQQYVVKPGQKLIYAAFEPSLSKVVKATVHVKELEEVELFAGKQKKRLLRVESQIDKIDNIQLPTMVSWLGDDLMPRRSEAEVPPFGKMTLYRTTRAIATSDADVDKLIDISAAQYVKLKSPIADPHSTTGAVYRITVRDETDLAGIFAQDARQRATVKDNVIELRVRAEDAADKSKEPDAVYTQSNYFINSADGKVKELALKAQGGAADPLEKARRIEKWVRDHMTGTSDEALAPADHVARTLRGDCTEYAMLTAAMCRAAGLPSRTAVGLVYGEVEDRPLFAFHMWTEVWVKGRWHSLDATLGLGRVGATHLKIADQSWQDVYDQTPLLAVFRVLGKLTIDVVEVENRR